MDMSEDLDSLNEVGGRRSMGMTLLVVAVFASLFMVLFLYSPVLWAVLCRRVRRRHRLHHHDDPPGRAGHAAPG